MLSAPEIFMAVANATSAIVEKAPPYLTYHVHASFHIAGDGDTDRTVTVRTDDGLAVVHDDRTGKDELRPPFPAAPTFDALSTFMLTATINAGINGARDGDLRITNVHPLHYVQRISHSDVVAESVRGYVVTVADDATSSVGHLHLERAAAGMAQTKWLRDVWYDPATMLPTRIVWNGINDVTLDARYAVVDTHWLLSNIAVTGTVHAPLWVARANFALRADYDRYVASAVAPDPRLVGSPVPLATSPP